MVVLTALLSFLYRTILALFSCKCKYTHRDIVSITILNNGNTEVMVIGKKLVMPKCTINVSDINLCEVQKFNNLVTWVTTD